jgi:23S rRNA (cytosine1962-C5)-methyltransferase
MTVPRLTLRPKSAGRVASGHPWVFSNELEPGFAELPAGCAVDVFDAKGAFVGRGLLSPNSLIAVRICSRLRQEDLDDPLFFASRLREALALRASVYPGRTAYRLVHAEGDFLPGLIIDRFGPYLAVQLNTVGMELRKPQLEVALQQVIGPAGVVLRNDNRVRELEGLELGRGLWFGEVAPHVDIDEFGVIYRVDLLGGQKTGHFFDQAENRLAAGTLCAGRTVLDVYANSGGFALQALNHGAVHATTVDKSAPNAEAALQNADLNGFGGRLEAVAAEGNMFLEQLVGLGRRFGAVVLDPPAFAKTRKTAGNALRGYQRINALGMTLTEPGGFLFTSTCSHHVQEDRFLEALSAAARVAGRRIRLLRRGEQAADHPVLPAVPETRYLKNFTVQVLM